MPSYPKSRISRLLGQCDAATSAAARGAAWEELVCYILGEVPGLEVRERDVRNSQGNAELDAVCWNDQPRNGLSFLPRIVLVEAKNWVKRVPSTEVVSFVDKLEKRCCDHGLLIASNGITGSGRTTPQHAWASVFEALQVKSIRLMVVVRSDIEQMKTTDDLVDLCKERLCKLVAMKPL